MTGQKISLKGACVMRTQHTGRPGVSVLVTATCSWCGHADSKCIAMLQRVGSARTITNKVLPLVAATHALCNTCFQEYWRAGGADREAV